MQSKSDPKETLIPIALIVLGLVILLVLGLSAGANTGQLLTALALTAIVGTVLMVVTAFLTAKLIKVSFGDRRAAILKFAGIYLISLAIGLSFTFVGAPLIVIVLSFVLILWLFDVTVYQAAIFTLVRWVISVLIALALMLVQRQR